MRGRGLGRNLETHDASSIVHKERRHDEMLRILNGTMSPHVMQLLEGA